MTPLDLLAANPPVVPADPTTTYVIMGGACIFILYTMTRLNRRKKKDPFETPFQSRGLAQHRSVERQMENLLVELSEMSRKMSAQLDTRAKKLEILIQDADERIARLEKLNAQAPPRPFAMPAEPAPPHAQPVVQQPQRPPAVVEAPPPAVVVAPPEPEPEPVLMNVEPPPEPEPPSEHEDVYRMADDGRTAREIATELSRPSGEIELILALRPRG